MREGLAILGMAAMTALFAFFYRHKECTGGGCGACGAACDKSGDVTAALGGGARDIDVEGVK